MADDSPRNLRGFEGRVFSEKELLSIVPNTEQKLTDFGREDGGDRAGSKLLRDTSRSQAAPTASCAEEGGVGSNRSPQSAVASSTRQGLEDPDMGQGQPQPSNGSGLLPFLGPVVPFIDAMRTLVVGEESASAGNLPQSPTSPTRSLLHEESEVAKLQAELRGLKVELETARKRQRELEDLVAAFRCGRAQPGEERAARSESPSLADLPRDARCGHGVDASLNKPSQAQALRKDEAQGPAAATAGREGSSLATAARPNTAWVGLFEQLGTDGSDQGSAALQKALEAQSGGMLLAQSDKLREMMELLENGQKSAMELEDLQGVMAEVFEISYGKVFLSLQMHARLAQLAAKHVTGADGHAPYMAAEAEHARPFTALARMSQQERKAVAQRLLEEVVPEMVERMADAFADAAMDEAGADANVKGKFNTMVLGNVSLFDRGLDGLIGYPKLDLRGAMQAEHDSGEEFQSFNFGKNRTTSAREQFKKVLPGGWDKPIDTYDYDGTVQLAPEGFEDHEMAKAADLWKEELVILRLYTGPMFVKYNGKMRDLLRAIEKYLEEGKPEDEAVQSAIDDAGPAFVTTIHVLCSALLKLRKVCPLPPKKKVYRGFSGMGVPTCFKRQDSRGNRGGVEFGFLSTSASKKHAIGYIKFERGFCQLYEMSVGQVDRGASLKWVSYFPEEDEVLLPPLCGLEAEGNARYEEIEVERFDDTTQSMVKLSQKIMVWPVRLNVNLKGKTLEELQSMRKNIHMSISSNTLQEIKRYVASELLSPAVRLKIENGSKTYDSLEEVEALQASIERQCREVVEKFKETRADWFNDDQHYSKAVADVLDLRSQAECMLDLWLIGGVSSAQTAKQLFLKDAAKKWLSKTHDRLAKAKEAGNLEEQQALASKLCRIKKLFAAKLDEKDIAGVTPLLHWSAEGYALAVTLLLDAGADAACVAKGKKTAFHLAVEGGHRQTALSMTAYSLVRDKMDSPDDFGRTPAWIVARAGWPDVMRELIAHGFDLSRPDDAGPMAEHRTPAFLLAEHGDAGSLELLAGQGADVSTPDKDGKTPAYMACEGNHIACLKILAKRGQGLSTPSNQRQTPAYVAAERSHVQCLLILAEQSADLSTADLETGRTPAYLLADRGQVEAMQVLAAKGADMSSPDLQTGRTPAFVLALNGHAETLKILADKGCDISSPDLQGQTPAYVACQGGHLECLRILAEHAAGLSTPDKELKTPAYVAAESGHEKCLALLAEQAADVWSPNLEGKTPVYVAAQHNHAHVLRLLALHRGPSKVDLDASDKMGWSPTWRAAASGHLEALQVLADNGADLMRAPSAGIFEATTPMKRAQQRNHNAVVDFFRQKVLV